MRTTTRRALLLLLTLVGAATGAGAQDFTFYLGEHTDFLQCGGSDLNTITPQLADFLRNRGWSGVHFMEASAWPQDLKEDSIGSGGVDTFWGDARNLSAYAGHGFTDSRFGLSYGIPHNGKCTLDIDAEMRLGERWSFGGNGRASYFMALTSCTLFQPHVAEVWVNSLATVGTAQVLGFHNSPQINDDEPRLFVENARSSTSKNNRTEWLNQMDNCGPWYWFCDNSPLVLSLGETTAEVQDIHFNANLWFRHFDPVIDVPAWFMWTLRDNGAGPCI